MLNTEKINKDTVAVSFHPYEIMLRKSGRAYFGKEETVASIVNGTLYIDVDVAKEFDLEVKVM